MANKLKRNYMQLVTGEDKEGNLTFETYLTPHFISTSVWYECVDVLEEIESMEEKANKAKEDGENVSLSKLMKEQLEMLMDTVIKVYGKQFNKKQLKEGMHAPNLVEDLQSQLQFIAMGQQDEATKKFVESKS